MSQDINYAESTITAAPQATVNEGSEVYWDLFLNTAKHKIINSYCGTHLNVFKGAWKRRFKEVASRLKFRIKNDSGDANSWQILISNELKAKRKSSSISASTHDTTKCSFIYVFLCSLLGLNLEVLTMDVPGKTFTRITRAKKLPFPREPKNHRFDFLPLLEVPLMGKALMENLARIIDNRKRNTIQLKKLLFYVLPFPLLESLPFYNIF